MCTILTIFFLFPLSPFFEVFLPYGLFFWCVFSYQYHLSFGPAKTINTQGSPSIPAPLFTLRTLFISFIAKLWVSGRLVLTVHSSYFPSSFLEHVIWRKRELKTDGMIMVYYVGFLIPFCHSHWLFPKVQKEINWVLMRIFSRSWYRRKVRLPPESLKYTSGNTHSYYERQKV